MRKSAKIFWIIWPLALLSGVVAAASPESGLQACRAIEAPGERLACYDRAAAQAAPVAESTARETPPAPSVGSPEAVTGPAPAAAAPAPYYPPPPAELRDTEIVRTVLTSTGRVQFRLANGELWEQSERRTTDLKAGDRVDLRQSPFGAWHLRQHEGAGRSVKVRRVDE